MVQPKYSPEEALERVKLMMKYDLSKTSTENKKVVSEQTQSNTPDPLSCIKNYFRTKTYFYYKEAKFKRNSVTGISEMEVTLNSKLIWKFFSANNGARTWQQFSEGALTDEGSWSCDGDSNFTMKSSSGKLNFDSKNGEQFFKQIQSVTQQPQATISPFLCIRNYCTSKQIPFDLEESARINGNKFIRVAWDKNKAWYFEEGGTWFEYTGQGLKPNEGKKGKWECDGYSNFIIEKDNGSIFKSLNPTEGQAQPVTQPTQTGLAAGFTNPSQQSELKRGDDPLRDILKNQSVDKAVCRQNIKNFYTAFKQKAKVDPQVASKVKGIVQACKNQHYGKFGVLGVGGKEIDRMLDVLTGRSSDEMAPSTQGPDSIFRIN